MTLTEIKEQLGTRYGIDVADFHVEPPNDDALAKRKYVLVERLIDTANGEVWHVWCNPQVWENRRP